MSVVYICVANGYAFEGATPEIAYEKHVKIGSDGDGGVLPPSACDWYEAFQADVSFTVKEKKVPKSKEKTK
jgi:hypothetical protein